MVSGSVVGSGGAVIASVLGLTVDELTTRAAYIVGLAVVALLLTGWRKPARAEPKRPRGTMGSTLDRAHRIDTGIVVEHDPGRPYRRPGPIRRLLALAGSGAIGILVGVLTAIVTAFAIAFAVIRLTELLQQ